MRCPLALFSNTNFLEAKTNFSNVISHCSPCRVSKTYFVGASIVRREAILRLSPSRCASQRFFFTTSPCPGGLFRTHLRLPLVSGHRTSVCDFLTHPCSYRSSRNAETCSRGGSLLHCPSRSSSAPGALHFTSSIISFVFFLVTCALTCLISSFPSSGSFSTPCQFSIHRSALCHGRCKTQEKRTSSEW